MTFLCSLTAGLSLASTRSWEGLNEPVSVSENILGAREPVQGQHRPAAGALQGATAGAGLRPRAASGWRGHCRLSGPPALCPASCRVVFKYVFLPETLVYIKREVRVCVHYTSLCEPAI